MDTITATHTRRSIRHYERRAVERDIIADILWDAAQAPTTPVSGPFLFHVIEGAERIAMATAPSNSPASTAPIPLATTGRTGRTSKSFLARRS